MKVLRKQVAMASSSGVECHEVLAIEAGDKYPVMRTDDLPGAIWLPGDGKANPADLCMSLAKCARNRGVKMHEGMEVTGVTIENGEAVGVNTVSSFIGNLKARAERTGESLSLHYATRWPRQELEATLHDRWPPAANAA